MVIPFVGDHDFNDSDFGKDYYSLDERKALAKSLTGAVKRFHDLGYVHKDIKYDNILAT